LDIDAARAAMPVCENYILLNHAGVAAPSGPCGRAVSEAMRDMCECATAHATRWMHAAEDGRRAFAEMIGAAAGDIAYVKNTTQGLLIAANGLPLRDGDNVILCEGEFPANVYPWLALERKGVEARMVPPRDGRITADVIREAMDARTRAVTLSYVQFGTGFRADLGSIGALCRERGIYFVVDMIQGVGAAPLDVSATPFDIGAADGHKWLLGPEGIGFMYCRPEILDDLAPIHVGWHSVTRAYDFDNYDATLRPGARRFEEGSPNLIGACGLAASVRLLLEWGVEAVFSRILELTDRIADHARRKGYELLSPMGPPAERSGIVVFRPPTGDPKGLVAALEERNVLAAARSGGIRFSPHAYNTVEEIDEAFDILAGATAQAK